MRVYNWHPWWRGGTWKRFICCKLFYVLNAMENTKYYWCGWLQSIKTIKCQRIKEKTCILSQIGGWTSYFQVPNFIFTWWFVCVEAGYWKYPSAYLFVEGLPIHLSFLKVSTVLAISNCSVFSYNILSDLKVMIVSTLTLIFASKPFKRSICLCSKFRLCYCFSETFSKRSLSEISQRSASLQGLSLVWQVLNVEQPGV